ncbi:hypothetical protein OEZ86_014018 [Tetradesmus obliquus]|nr:hypothetical protein OEZ86_014018 [Tetradesmus obliquus]
MFHFLGGQYHGRFEATYRAFPLAFIDKQSAEYGDKVILPPSALDRLASLHIEYPMLFKVVNNSTGRSTHCGVLEFVAQEGHVYLPRWMMANLLLTEGQPVSFANVSLPKGTYVKLQPVTSDFLDISNPKAVLERTLRSYSCLTVGDCFVVHYNNKDYEIEVRSCKPGEAISIIETDCQVDFEAAKDYKEPTYTPAAAAAPLAAAAGAAGGSAAAAAEPEEEEGPKFVPFVGTGRRLDGKPASSSSGPPAASAAAAAAAARAAAAAGAGSSSGSGGGGSAVTGGAKPGTFVSLGNRLADKLALDKLKAQGKAPAPPPAEEEKPDEGPAFKPFEGKGRSLKG